MKIKDILAHRKVPLFKAQKHVPYTTIPPGTGKDRTVVDLTAEGFPEIPAVGMRHSVTAAEGASASWMKLDETSYASRAFSTDPLISSRRLHVRPIEVLVSDRT